MKSEIRLVSEVRGGLRASRKFSHMEVAVDVGKGRVIRSNHGQIAIPSVILQYISALGTQFTGAD